MKHILMLLMLWVSLPVMAQRLVCESSPIDIGEKNAVKDKIGNEYAVIRVYALGFDINTLEIKKDGLIDDIIKRNTYYEVYIVCTGYKTKIEMSTRTNGYLSVPIITQGDYSDSNDEEYDVGRGVVYKLEIKLEQVRPSLFRITENQYIENLSHKSALQGTTITFEVKERNGYALDYVTIDGQRIRQDSRLYSFTMPAKDVHIAAYYEPKHDQEVIQEPINVQYQIIADDSHIILNKSKAYKGERVSFEISDKQGYTLKNIIIDNHKYENTLRSFVMGEQNVHISLEYEKINVKNDDKTNNEIENTTQNNNDVEFVTKVDGSRIETIYYKGNISTRKYRNPQGELVKIEIYNEFGKLKDTIIY